MCLPPSQPELHAKENWGAEFSSFSRYSIFWPAPVQKGPPFLFAMFPEEQTSHLVNLNVQMNRKNTNKKYVGPVQVISNFGDWIPDYKELQGFHRLHPHLSFDTQLVACVSHPLQCYLDAAPSRGHHWLPACVLHRDTWQTAAKSCV